MSRQSILCASVLVFIAASCTRDPQKLKKQYADSGDQYFAKKNYNEAIIQYRNALAQDTTFGEARLKLATAYEANQDLNSALQEYVRAADSLPDNARAQLNAGKLLVAAGQFPEAKTRALAVLEKDPKNVNALIVLGNALAGMKDIDGAIEHIEQAIGAEPGLTFAYANLGLLQATNGQASAAQSAFKRAVDSSPQSVEPHLNLGNYYWASGQRPEAEKEFLAALALDPKSVEINRILAAFYLTGSEGPKAEPYFKVYADGAPEITGKIALADYYLGNQRTDEAVKILQAASKEKEGYGPAKLRLAMIDFKAGRRQDAYKTINELLDRPGQNGEALQTKARFQTLDKNFDEAVKTCDAAIKADPKFVMAHFIRGVALESKGSTDDAIAAFQKVLELAPTTAAAQFRLANLYMAQRKPQAAIEFLGQVLKKAPRSGEAQLLMAQAYLQAGDLDNAAARIVPLAKANSNSADVQITLGRLYGAKNQLAQSRDAFSAALKLAPDSLLALNGIVTLDLVQKKYDAVRSTLKTKVSEHPDDREILFLAANSYVAIGELKDAEALFQKILELDPQDIDAYGRLGALYLAENRLDEAKAKFEEAAKRQDNPVIATTLVGVMLSMQNKDDEARAQYKRALDIDPKAAVAANNLAADYAERSGDLDLALKLAQTAKSQLTRSAQVTDTLGWIYYKKGLSTLAVSTLRDGVNQNPNLAVIHYHLGLAYIKTGDLQQAQKSLQEALKLNPKSKWADDARSALSTIDGKRSAAPAPGLPAV